MNKLVLILAGALMAPAAFSENVVVKSPDGGLEVTVSDDNGKITYKASLDGKQMLEPSRLGLKTDVGNFADGLKIKNVSRQQIDETYSLNMRAKTDSVSYKANEAVITCVNTDNNTVDMVIRVSDNDIAMRYVLPMIGDNRNTVVEEEVTSFKFPSKTTTYLSPQAPVYTGFAQTKPSYEEDYLANRQMSEKSAFGLGWIFPSLFRVGDDGWVLVSETGVGGNYCASRLSDYDAAEGYTVAYPTDKEGNGLWRGNAKITLPGATPWRTVTIGESLAPIVETTVQWDVVEPLYEASETYRPGRYTWSWLLWGDSSMNYADQKTMIDLASEMGYEYVLVDALWDSQVGRDKIEEFAKYARSRGVDLMLWYNSNGLTNDAPQGPRNGMHNSIARKREMKWMHDNGIKGIKVDFFGSDSQGMMQVYEDILSDANEYGIQVIFHGCTMPRGWERMYPNFVASEAVLASENLVFGQYHCDREGFELTMHPYCRNTVANMDWGGTIMNRRLSRDNKDHGTHRRSSNTFELASAIMNQTPIQCVAIYPNNLDELADFELDFLKSFPTTWNETRHIDGMPGEYSVIARRHGNSWYAAGLNASDKPLKKKISLPMFAGKSVQVINDTRKKDDQGFFIPEKKTVTIPADGLAEFEIQPFGGIIIMD